MRRPASPREERLIERLLDLLSKIRRSLRNCAEQLAETAEKPQKLLRMIADMLDEGHLGTRACGFRGSPVGCSLPGPRRLSAKSKVNASPQQFLQFAFAPNVFSKCHTAFHIFSLCYSSSTS